MYLNEDGSLTLEGHFTLTAEQVKLVKNAQPSPNEVGWWIVDGKTRDPILFLGKEILHSKWGSTGSFINGYSVTGRPNCIIYGECDMNEFKPVK